MIRHDRISLPICSSKKLGKTSGRPFNPHKFTLNCYIRLHMFV